MLAILILGSQGLRAQSAADPWKPLQFLVGEWTAADNAGRPGRNATGSSTLKFDLDRKVLIRRNIADYPNGTHHEDLMVIYPGEPMRAIYWDNEGHVINYRVTSADDSVVFISEPTERTPRFRLTYTKTSERTVSVQFEVAPPGRPDQFRKYITASLNKQQPEP